MTQTTAPSTPTGSPAPVDADEVARVMAAASKRGLTMSMQNTLHGATYRVWSPDDDMLAWTYDLDEAERAVRPRTQDLRGTPFERSPLGSDNGLPIRTFIEDADTTSYIYGPAFFLQGATDIERLDPERHGLEVCREICHDVGTERFILMGLDHGFTRSDAALLLQALAVALADPVGR